MQRKYFEALAIMDRENLRSNMFHHSCIIFLYANCDENDNIISPLYVLDSYSFYSHPLPYRKSFQEEPLAFFTQKITPEFRFRGSFGEWRQEKIHDLTFGKGLTGRLFEKEKAQVDKDIGFIKSIIDKQEKFLACASTLIEQEEEYTNFSRKEFIQLVKLGVDPVVARKQTENLKPLPEFNSFPLSGGASTCKTANLNIIASGYDQQNTDHQIILNYINYLRYGSLSDNYFNMFRRFLVSFIPRLTPKLDELVFHCSSDKWEARGEKSKFPYCKWEDVQEGDIFAVTAGEWYVSLDGNMQPLTILDNECKEVVSRLKMLGRLCEINLADETFKPWHKKINHFISKIATSSHARQQHIWSVAANEYISNLISCEAFTTNAKTKIPANLKPLLGILSQPDKLKLSC